jgi:hypothetical protein
MDKITTVNNNSLIPIGSTELVRVGNSLAVTNKILSESKYEYYNEFSGEIFEKLSLNIYGQSFLDINNMKLIILTQKGIVTLVDLNNFTIDKLSLKIFHVIEDNKLFDWMGSQIYIKHSCFHENYIYLSRENQSLLRYDYINDEIKEFILSEQKDEILSCAYKDIYIQDNKLYCITLNIPPLEELEQDISTYYNSITVFSLDFKKIDSILGLDITYCNLVISEGFLFATTDWTLDEYKGQILKQNLSDGSYSFIKISDDYIHDVLFIDIKYIYCIVKNHNKDDFNFRLIKLDGNSESIDFSLELQSEVIRTILSSCKMYIGIIFKGGLVKIFHYKLFKLITEFILEDYNNLQPSIFHIHNKNIYIGNEKILIKYI